jgi:hypothetical protein
VDPGDKGIFALALRTLPVRPFGVVLVTVAGNGEFRLRAAAVTFTIFSGGVIGGRGGSGLCGMFFGR